MSVLCSKCKSEIPAGRLKALPNATTCVSCSTSKMKRAITVTGGEREDTYNDIIIMEADQYEYLFGPDRPSNSGFGDHSSAEENLND